jgi:hypothetical protein
MEKGERPCSCPAENHRESQPRERVLFLRARTGREALAALNRLQRQIVLPEFFDVPNFDIILVKVPLFVGDKIFKELFALMKTGLTF